MKTTRDSTRKGAAGDQGPPDFECLDTEQVSPDTQAKARAEGNRPLALLGYLLLGAYLGVVFVQAEVVSWFRIQEMFRFQSFHMYGIIGTAVAVAALSVQVIKRMEVKTIHGEPIRLSPKDWGDSRIPGARYWIGGTLFGMGWALLGACPGPIFALLGAGITVLLVALASALAGTWAYAALRTRLPH
ncbi:MAG: YeeE/YedE family protein [Gemmatimonadales bacterium]|nr:MAG: YeeE/YedE family protein [Gemmatimonadales bacterium]